ncbi:MAG: CoA transferase, partial [Alphaproteobacteria bacterium]|nr:CoA transferase [Alphaproteobacteria bacterium]
ATHAFGGICAALVRRQNNGPGEDGGEYIDVALMDVMHQMLAYEVQAVQIENVPPPVVFEPVKTLDGFIMITPISQLNFEALALGAKHPEWKDDARFSTIAVRVRNWDALMANIAAWAADQEADACIKALSEAGCPCTRYLTVAQSIAQPQVAHRGSMIEVEDGWGRYQVPNSPFQFANAQVQARSWIAEQGQHNDEILTELGLDRGPD